MEPAFGKLYVDDPIVLVSIVYLFQEVKHKKCGIGVHGIVLQRIGKFVEDGWVDNIATNNVNKVISVEDLLGPVPLFGLQIKELVKLSWLLGPLLCKLFDLVKLRVILSVTRQKFIVTRQAVEYVIGDLKLLFFIDGAKLHVLVNTELLCHHHAQI